MTIQKGRLPGEPAFLALTRGIPVDPAAGNDEEKSNADPA